MKSLLPLAVASATALGAITIPATAQSSSDAQSVMALLQRLSSHYSILLMRSFVDVTYDQLTVEPGTNNIVITGLKVYPELEWDPDALCEVTVARATSADILSFETLGSSIEMSGVNVPAACFDPEVAGMMGSFGYDGLTSDNMSIGLSYNLPDSSADLTINASVEDAADVSVSAAFSYFWFRIPIDGGGDPTPVIQLSEAEIGIENKGLWERVEPMVGAQMGDLNAIPPMIQTMLGQALTEGGQRTPTQTETAFVENLASEVQRFLTEKNRIVLTANPEDGVWIDEDIFDSPQNMIAALQPKISGTPNALRSIVPPADMAAALANGANPDEATRLKIGRALLTGIGAPRSLEDGGELLLPLAQNWNGEAAALLADAAESVGENKIGYEMALIAIAQGEVGAMSTADALESKLPLGEVLAMQRASSDKWPGGSELSQQFEAAIASGDVSAIRGLANAVSIGRGLPRDYSAAYSLATLGAAAGDRASANLRDRMDRRFGELDQKTWAEAAASAASEALKVWTDGGFGAAMAAKVQ